MKHKRITETQQQHQRKFQTRKTLKHIDENSHIALEKKVNINFIKSKTASHWHSQWWHNNNKNDIVSHLASASLDHKFSSKMRCLLRLQRSDHNALVKRVTGNNLIQSYNTHYILTAVKSTVHRSSLSLLAMSSYPRFSANNSHTFNLWIFLHTLCPFLKNE